MKGTFKGSDGKTYYIQVPAPHYHFKDDYVKNDEHYYYGFIWIENQPMLATYWNEYDITPLDCFPHGRWVQVNTYIDFVNAGGMIYCLKKGVPEGEEFYEGDVFRKVYKNFDKIFPNMEHNKIYKIRKNKEDGYFIKRFLICEKGVER